MRRRLGKKQLVMVAKNHQTNNSSNRYIVTKYRLLDQGWHVDKISEDFYRSIENWRLLLNQNKTNLAKINKFASN